MASIVSHLVYANEFLKIHPKLGQTQQFMLGVSFPDIRRICNVTRAQTHNCFESLDLHFENLSLFEAGWKFHVWCDLRRSEVLLEKGFFDLEEIHDCYYFSPYLVEDRLVWGEYQNWETLKNFFENVSFVDVFEQLTEGDWMFWFDLTAQFIGTEPDRASIRNIVQATPSFSPRTDLILDEVDRLMENKKVTQILFDVHNEILK